MQTTWKMHKAIPYKVIICFYFSSCRHPYIIFKEQKKERKKICWKHKDSHFILFFMLHLYFSFFLFQKAKNKKYHDGIHLIFIFGRFSSSFHVSRILMFSFARGWKVSAGWKHNSVSCLTFNITFLLLQRFEETKPLIKFYPTSGLL